MGLAIPVQIIGINEVGLESDNDLMTAGRDLPWLQDTIEVDVWTQWSAGYRDVILVDEHNREVDRFNVTTYDLADPINYAMLVDLFVDLGTP